MRINKISSVPVVNSDDEPVGIVTSNDFSKEVKDSTPISEILPDHVYSVPAYNDASAAAKVMLNHHIHHVLVTHEKKLAGMISSFDLLALLDEHKFTMKNAPTANKKKKRNY